MDQKRYDGTSRINSPARAKRRAKKEKMLDATINGEKNFLGRNINDAMLLNAPLGGSGNLGQVVRFLEKTSTMENHCSKERKLLGLGNTLSSDYSTTGKLSLYPIGSFLDNKSESFIGSGSLESQDFLPRMRQSQYLISQNRKLKILATLLPDEILKDPISRKPRPYPAALMFPDVSGFTQLCEKYDKTGKGGPSRLTQVLNGYIGSMINIVLSRNGDICKFGGDAFLCAWTVTENTNIREIVHLAIESAVNIQKNCGEYRTDVGVKLGVKIAIAAGEAAFSIIGSEARKYYVITGSPVMDVRDAECIGITGDIIVAPSAWKYVENYMLYSFTYHSDNKHIKVHDFGPLWKSAKSYPTGSELASDNINARPMLKFIAHLQVENIRPFILPPVMKSIDMNQSLDYLTEMRQVAIVFFNIAADFRSISKEEIIDLSNKVFQMISSVVDKSDGATNKVTLFDKDMAILTVFGLKGFKHEIASLVALKCAYNCMDQLKKMQVGTVSAGVTTGMAYCGVLGHKLRREYTVMGHPVNMAARLMCAYENIVSSDRNTFLHSKLDSSHFELLEQKFLKGIENAGPFYKFNLYPKRKKMKIDSKSYPIIGRVREIREFQRFLNNSGKSDNDLNFMVIYGEPRIGKSCLVAKFISIVEKLNAAYGESNTTKSYRWEMNVISLTEDDSKSSFATLRLIFYVPFGLNEESSVEEREDKILSKLGPAKDFNFLASLNPIFNVNFDLTPQYLALTHDRQVEVQQMILRSIYEKCFPKGAKWLIVIDDAEFIDEDSWGFLALCWNISRTVLYVLTIGQRRQLPIAALDFLETAQIKKITLSVIEKWFYTALACQILGVKALPVELVNLLQSYNSSGNPGWMESFLQSLIQFGSIYVTELPFFKVKTLKLVTAPAVIKHLTELPTENDSSYWIDCVENFEVTNDYDFKVPVCLLGTNFYSSNENDSELTMDVMLIKTIDTLKPIEQLILKAGSVLGNNFKRSALKFVISKEMLVEERIFAKAIKSLFDIKILTCAKGDLTQSNLITPRNMILMTSIRKDIICECKGIIIPDDCRGLPQYANCGFMQFKTPTFRDTLYNLLLDEQKKKFHGSSIEFLRKYTYKCKACKSVPFTNVFGVEINNELHLVSNFTPMHGVRSAKLERDVKLPPQSRAKNTRKTLLAHDNPIKKNNDQSLDFEPRNFLKIELRDCHCPDILSSVYSVLLEHAAGCGRKDIMLEVQLEYASVSLTSYNIPLTMQILEEALALINQMREDKEYPNFCTPYLYGKIYTLMGATKLSMGRTDDSLSLLKTGLLYMKKSVSKDQAKANFLIKSKYMKHRFQFELFLKKRVGQSSGLQASYSDLLSECLGLISINHIYMENWMLAKYAAVCALNKALESNRNFYGLCTAYTSMMDVAYHFNDLKTCARMETCAIDMCKRCTQDVIEIYELEAVARLYKVIFQTRYARAEIEEAVQIGFQSIKIASIIANTSLRLELMPDLIFALIQLNRLPEAVSLLQELEFTSTLDSDKSSRIWYYALCLDFQLDTGYTVISFDTCQQFVREEEANLLVVRDPHAKHRLLVGLWLWCLRNEEWELSRSYARMIKLLNPLEGKETPGTVFTRLKKLEGFLITLVHKMDLKNIYAINATYKEIFSLMHKLNKEVKNVKLLRPRFKILKAYYRQIRYRDDSCFRVLKHALAHAEKMNDRKTSEWIRHLKMVWSSAISPIQRDFWVDHSRRNLIDWHECEGDAKTVLYSLPLPKF